MNGHIFDVLIVGALIYEYFKREREHKSVIANLKEGIYPDNTVLHKDLIGIVLMGIVTMAFIGFLLFLTFFFPMKIHFPFLLLPYGICGILIFIIKRDISIYKNNKRQ